MTTIKKKNTIQLNRNRRRLFIYKFKFNLISVNFVLHSTKLSFTDVPGEKKLGNLEKNHQPTNYHGTALNVFHGVLIFICQAQKILTTCHHGSQERYLHMKVEIQLVSFQLQVPKILPTKITVKQLMFTVT